MIEINLRTYIHFLATRLFKMAWQHNNWMQQMPVVHSQNLNITTPMVPEAYSALQYPNATAEQQYDALQQQNWTQWQAYQQQYAQWQAQYGEQVIHFSSTFFAKFRYNTS